MRLLKADLGPRSIHPPFPTTLRAADGALHIPHLNEECNGILYPDETIRSISMTSRFFCTKCGTICQVILNVMPGGHLGPWDRGGNSGCHPFLPDDLLSSQHLRPCRFISHAEHEKDCGRKLRAGCRSSHLSPHYRKQSTQLLDELYKMALEEIFRG